MGMCYCSESLMFSNLSCIHCITQQLDCSRHITLVLIKKLHWHSVKQQTVYKILLVTFYCQLISSAPPYLADLHDTMSYSMSSNHLWVSSSTCRFRDQSFSLLAPQMWNNLPSDLKTLTTSLKRHLFKHTCSNTPVPCCLWLVPECITFNYAQCFKNLSTSWTDLFLRYNYFIYLFHVFLTWLEFLSRITASHYLVTLHSFTTSSIS